MDDSTEGRLAEIEARMNAASEGPWRTQESSNGGAILLRGRVGAAIRDRHPQSHLQIVPVEDAEFIAAARSDMEWLLSIARSGMEDGKRLTFDADAAVMLLRETAMLCDIQVERGDTRRVGDGDLLRAIAEHFRPGFRLGLEGEEGQSNG